jgi:ferrous iron transport protein B
MGIINIALVGNPNTGKSSLFNALTGLQQKTGNYPGITVDKYLGVLKATSGDTIHLIDLPGTYSLLPSSLDEEVTFQTLTNNNEPDYPQAIIYIADASQLKKNFPLLIQLQQLKIPLIFVLNMEDEAKKNNLQIDIEGLKKELRIPIFSTNARKGVGTSTLKKYLINLDYLSPSFVNESDSMYLSTHPFFINLFGTDNSYISQLKANYYLKFPQKNEEQYQFLIQRKKETGIDYGEELRKDILYRRRLKNVPDKLCKIAKSYGISSERVRQVEDKIILKLRSFAFAR